MSIKRRIRYKNTPVFVNEDEEYCEDLAKSFKGEKDRPRFEEHDEEDYIEHCRKFFKGEVE
tara:strand:+ start:360 stop:542 length:183 start_codon:yes stop_codon:yes gene_type:complete